MAWLARLFARPDDRGGLRPLYEAMVDVARRPRWYREGGVPDTLDGRFDMVAAILSVLLIRLEREGEAAARSTARLTELFVADMDAQLREDGVGDTGVGKQVGRMMSALGGRLGAYRAGFAEGRLDDALVRNLYRGVAPPAPALAAAKVDLHTFAAALAATPAEAILQGRLP